jgi:hypothetical protein
MGVLEVLHSDKKAAIIVIKDFVKKHNIRPEEIFDNEMLVEDFCGEEDATD